MNNETLQNLRLILFFTITFSQFMMGSAIAGATGPQQMIKEKIDLGMQILKDPNLQGIDKTIERREKLWSELQPLFDFNEIAKRALGPHWNTISDDKKGHFTELFTAVLKNVYLGKSDNYSGENVKFTQEIIQGTRSRVETLFISTKGDAYKVHFNLHKTKDGWRIYDIIIEGVSIISNYRSQFNEILAKSPFEKLVAMLEEKIVNLEGVY